MMSTGIEMPRYQCHKKVWALKIRDVFPLPPPSNDVIGPALLAFEDQRYASRQVDGEWICKHQPQPGGYFVQYEGGYTSFSPAEAFESGYAPLKVGSGHRAEASIMNEATQAIEECSNLVTFAHTELSRAGLFAQDGDYGGALGEAVMEVVTLFASQGHSGFSASMALDCIRKLLAFEPLSPITDEPEDWIEVGTGVFQHKRCPRIFRQANRFDGQAYDIDGRVYRELDGSTWNNSESAVPITFPYTPKTEVIDAPKSIEVDLQPALTEPIQAPAVEQIGAPLRDPTVAEP